MCCMHGILVHLMPEDIKAFKQLSTQSHFSICQVQNKTAI